MSDVDINSMSFKQLKNEVQELRDTVTRMKRMYEDILYNLDDDNFSSRFVKEKNGMKAEIKITAEEISSVVENVDDIEQEVSEISQTAGKISSIVSKNISAYFVKNEMPTESNTTAIEQSMLCLYDRKYYYYSDIDREWKKYPASGLKTMFEQTSTGFKLTGDVSISGDLITSGTISGITVEANSNYYRDNVRITTDNLNNTPKLEIVLGNTVVGTWMPTAIGSGSSISPKNGAKLNISDVTAIGDWDFSNVDSVIGLPATVAVFG